MLLPFSFLKNGFSTSSVYSLGSGTSNSGNYNGITPDLAYVQSLSPPPTLANGGPRIAGANALYSWSAKGRYVAWSTDHGASWTLHDYGADLSPDSTYMQVTRGVIAGVDRMLIHYGDNGIAIYASFAYPPTKISGAPSSAYAGHIGVIPGGSVIVRTYGFVDYQYSLTYYSGSAWVYSQPITGKIPSATMRTSAGTWLCCGQISITGFGIYRSTDFSTWSERDVITGTGTYFVIGAYSQTPTGTIVVVRYGGTGDPYTTLKYSSNDGVTWTTCAMPTLAVGVRASIPVWDTVNSRMFVLLDNGTALISSDGLTWTLTATTGTYTGVGIIQNAFTQLTHS